MIQQFLNWCSTLDSQSLMVGAIIGLSIMFWMWLIKESAYARTLQMIGAENGMEKIGDRWYVIRLIKTEDEARSSQQYLDLVRSYDQLVNNGLIAAYDLHYNAVDDEWFADIHPIPPVDQITIADQEKKL